MTFIVIFGPNNDKSCCCVVYLFTFKLQCLCEENTNFVAAWFSGPGEGPRTVPEPCVWLTNSKTWCFLKHACVLRVGYRPIFKTGLSWMESSRGASVRWRVCTACVHIVVCVCLRMHALQVFPGYHWMASLLQTHLNLRYGGFLFYAVALSLSFGHISTASTIQTLSAVK